MAGIQLLASKESEEDLYAGILSVIAEVVPFEQAAILLQSEPGDVVVAASSTSDFRMEDIKNGGFVQRAVAGEAFLVEALAETTHGQTSMEIPKRMASGIFTPLHAGSQHGCMVCLHSETQVFEDRHLATLSRFGPLASQVVRRAGEIAELKRSVDRLEQVAHHDGLTGLANRKRFIETLSDYFFTHHKGNFALFQLDLDRFKAINDSLGHAAGDYLLTVVGRRLAQATRPSDFCARLGGDEFAVILDGLDEKEEIAGLAQRILAELERPVTFEGRTVMPGTSIGISRYPFDGQNAKSLMNAADLALYNAKSEGGGRYAFFGSDLKEEAERFQSMEAMVRSAVSGDQLQVHYQPICNMKTGEILAFEALLRLLSDDGHYVAPKDVIDAAERTRLMSSLTEWIVERALEDLSEWLVNKPGRRVAINLSSSELIAPDLVPMLASSIARHGLKPENVELELNEEITSERLLNSAMGNLDALNAEGFLVAFDDFGTGYTSLKHLRGFPGHRLKLDKSLVQEIELTSANQSLVRSLVDLASSLNLKTVAEGIETQEQFQMCRDLGCSEGQGYLIAPPSRISHLLSTPESGSRFNFGT